MLRRVPLYEACGGGVARGAPLFYYKGTYKKRQDTDWAQKGDDYRPLTV
jgi:hypothetical protein